jgi:ubiquitin-protein ligase
MNALEISKPNVEKKSTHSKRIEKEMKLFEDSDNFQVVIDEMQKNVYILFHISDPPYGGYYIGKFVLPDNYPFSPPEFYMLTPNGKFEINIKICTTNTSYHAESWTPAWTLRTLALGFTTVFYDFSFKGLGHIETNERDTSLPKYAKKSVEYNLKYYRDIFVKFDKYINPNGTLKIKH